MNGEQTQRDSRRGKVTLLLVLLLFLGSVTPQLSIAQQHSTTVPFVYTIAENPSTFGVYLELNGVARQLTTVAVNDHVNTLTVQTSLSPNGERVAIIPNFDTSAGTDLRVYDIAAGQEWSVEQGRIVAAVWSPQSNKLVYMVRGEQGAEVHISDGRQPGQRIAQIAGDKHSLLGWSSDEHELYLTSLTFADGALIDEMAILDVETGSVRTLFKDGDGIFYDDFRLLTTAAGTQYISFIKSDVLWPSCQGMSSLNLATVDGTPVVEYGVTPDNYRAALWSSDGTKVAYSVRACVDKRDGETALARLEDINGVYVADVVAKQVTQIITGLPREHQLTMLDNDVLHLATAQAGNVPFDTQNSMPVPASQLDGRATLPGTQRTIIRNNYTVFVHQLWDTPDWFDGHWACGPTSAVMTLGWWFLPAKRITVSYPYSHTNDYGFYVPNEYTYRGVTYYWTEPDPQGTLAKGAYGYVVGGGLAQWNLLTAYLQLHGTVVRQVNPGDVGGAAWVRARLDAYDVVISSGSGHLTVIRGYTDDGYFIVNDPYGPNSDGSYNGTKGNGELYTWSRLNSVQLWAVTRS